MAVAVDDHAVCLIHLVLPGGPPSDALQALGLWMADTVPGGLGH